MSDFTAAYTELVDKVFRDGVHAAGLSAAAGEHDHHAHHHEHSHGVGGDDVVTQSTLAVLKQATGGDAGGLSDIVIAKATAMTVLFVAALCAGLIPFKLAQWFKWKQGGTETGRTGLIVSLLLAFGGGVLLCTTFLHLLPEVKENVERLQASGALPRVGFHLAEFLMCVGFFTMYLIEQSVHAYLHARDERRNKSETTASAFRRGVSVRESSSFTAAATAAAVARRKKLNDQRNGSISIAELIENDANDAAGAGGRRNSTGNKYNLAAVEIVPKSDAAANHKHGHGAEHTNAQRHGHSHLHLPVGKAGGGDGDEDAVATSLRGLLIVLALSVHELFEGLAVGLEGSAANVWYLFGAVAAHKLVLAFCVGVELIVARTRTWLAFVYVLTFSVVSPIGIGIGILVSSQADGGGSGLDGDGSGGGVVSVLLQGLATGTLLYVVFFEILQKDKSGLVQLVAVLVGFFIMFGLQFICEYIWERSIKQGFYLIMIYERVIFCKSSVMNCSSKILLFIFTASARSSSSLRVSIRN